MGINGFFFNIPDSAGCVDAGGSDASRFGFVPIEGSEGSTILAVLVSIKEALEFNLVVVVVVVVVGVGDLPDSEEVAGGSEEVGAETIFVGDEDGFGGRVRVFEGEVRVGTDLTVGIVELNDFDSVWVLFEE